MTSFIPMYIGMLSIDFQTKYPDAKNLVEFVNKICKSNFGGFTIQDTADNNMMEKFLI